MRGVCFRVEWQVTAIHRAALTLVTSGLADKVIAQKQAERDAAWFDRVSVLYHLLVKGVSHSPSNYARETLDECTRVAVSLQSSGKISFSFATLLR